jgi:hypothetical protein
MDNTLLLLHALFLVFTRTYNPYLFCIADEHSKIVISLPHACFIDHKIKHLLLLINALPENTEIPIHLNKLRKQSAVTHLLLNSDSCLSDVDQHLRARTFT